MDIRELKKLLKNSTSVLILDDGEPAFVVLDYGVYKNVVLDKDKEKEVRINHAGQGANGPPNSLGAGNGGTDEHSAEPSFAEASEGKPATNAERRESEVLERLNKEILALKHQIELEERREFGVPEPAQE